MNTLVTAAGLTMLPQSRQSRLLLSRSGPEANNLPDAIRVTCGTSRFDRGRKGLCPPYSAWCSRSPEQADPFGSRGDKAKCQVRVGRHAQGAEMVLADPA